MTLRDKVCRCAIRKPENVKPLLRIQRSQLRWLGHLSKMPRESLARQVLLAIPTGKGPIGRPRTRWSEYISDLAWTRLGTEPAEISEIAVDCEASRVLLRLLALRPSLRKSSRENE